MNESFKKRLNYLRRIFKVYFSSKPSYLSFWHEKPAVSENVTADKLGVYYMTFSGKAGYDGPKDEKGVILFDYFFDIGRQYNPLAIAQYGLGHYNKYLETKDNRHFEVAKIQADWLVDNLEENDFGLMVWKHKFRWHYKKYLAPGWFSAHSQGTGISLLLRIYEEIKEEKYLKAAELAFLSLDKEIKSGGTKYVDEKGNVWLEEYLVKPPTHILNGFLWALWGVWDYWIFTKDEKAGELWNACVKTLRENLGRYDAGFWSLYDLSKQKMKMIASPFYHSLHIVQLRVMRLLTDKEVFKDYADRFDAYWRNPFKKARAFLQKIIFKIFYF